MVLYFLFFGFLVCKFDNIKRNRAAKWLLKNAGVYSHCQVFLFYKLQVILKRHPYNLSSRLNLENLSIIGRQILWLYFPCPEVINCWHIKVDCKTPVQLSEWPQHMFSSAGWSCTSIVLFKWILLKAPAPKSKVINLAFLLLTNSPYFVISQLVR